MADHYSTLGVSPTATQAEIKAAYRRLVLQYHPDRNKEPGATERFIAIQAAWDVLSDPASKSAYDYGRNVYSSAGTYTAPPQPPRKAAPNTPPHSDPYARQEDLYSDDDTDDNYTYTNTHSDPYAPQFGDKPFTPYSSSDRISPHLYRVALMLPLVLYLFLSGQVCNEADTPPTTEHWIVDDSVVSTLILHGDTVFTGGQGHDTLVIP